MIVARQCSAPPTVSALVYATSRISRGISRIRHPGVQLEEHPGRGCRRVPVLESLEAGDASLSPFLGIAKDRDCSAGKRLVVLGDDDPVVARNALRPYRIRDHGQPGGERLEHLDLCAAAAHRRKQQDRDFAHELGARGHFALDLHAVVGAESELVHAAAGHAKPRLGNLAANERPDPVHKSVRGRSGHRPSSRADEAHDRVPTVEQRLVVSRIEDEWNDGDVGVRCFPTYLVRDGVEFATRNRWRRAA